MASKKISKKKLNQLKLRKSIRKDWKFNPVERIKESEKNYNRRKSNDENNW